MDTNNTSIRLTNKKVIEFYQKNPSISFETVNLIFVELFEHVLHDMSSVMNTTINSQILSTVGDIKNNVASLTTTVSTLNNDITNNIIIRFHESKREYIDDVKNIISTNMNTNVDRIASLLERNIEQLIDKTTLLLNDIIPKNNQNYYIQLNDTISLFRKSVSDDTNKLLSSVNKEDSLKEFLQSFENKSSSLLQPLYTFINSSEERINNNITLLKENTSTHQTIQDKVMKELGDFLGKYKNSSFKGQFGENMLETVLAQMFPSAEVINTTGCKASCDFRINREDSSTLLIETKDYDRNVTLDEVKKFIRDIEEQGCHGIFLSQHSGITSKQNFQIDIRGKNILVYVHNVDYCQHTIKIAVDIIDSLSCKLLSIEDNTCENTISKEELDEINREYSSFTLRKSAIIDILKDFQKKILCEVEEIKFPTLSKYLTTKYGAILNDENEKITCNLCNIFKASNNKSLAAHQRGCNKKFAKQHDIGNIEIVLPSSK
jgi:hypothetical protein